METLNDMSPFQFAEMMEKLERMSLSASIGAQSQVGSTAQISIQHERDVVKECVERLCSLASAKPRDTDSSVEADGIIDDLEEIVKFIEATYATDPVRGPGSSNPNSSQQLSTTKAIRRGLASAEHFDHMGKQVVRTVDGLGYSREDFAVSVPYATFHISVSRKRKRGLEAESSAGIQSTDIFGRLSILPMLGAKCMKLNFTYAKRAAKSCAWTIYHTLSFCSVRDPDDEIFRVIALGDVTDLQYLLEKREVSITDCDPKGNGLLTVFTLPKVMTILTNNGLACVTQLQSSDVSISC